MRRMLKTGSGLLTRQYVVKLTALRTLVLLTLFVGALQMFNNFSDVSRVVKKDRKVRTFRERTLITPVAIAVDIRGSEQTEGDVIQSNGAAVQTNLRSRVFVLAPNSTDEFEGNFAEILGRGLRLVHANEYRKGSYPLERSSAVKEDTMSKEKRTDSFNGDGTVVNQRFVNTARSRRKRRPPADGSATINQHVVNKQILDTTRLKGTYQQTCDGCFKHTFKFLYTAKHVCGSASRIDLVFLITSAPTNSVYRDVLRNTWLNDVNTTSHMRYVFLLGSTPDRNIAQSVQLENEKYQDMVMEDFIDTYHNLTYKTVMGLRWVGDYCPQAKFVMKTDDDVFVFVPRLSKLLESRYIRDKLAGSVIGDCSFATKPIRDSISKYYVSYKSYPRDSFPPFCRGVGYVMSMRTATSIYDISKNVPFFYLEDVYVGLCLQQAGITVFRYEGYELSMFDAHTDICHTKQGRGITVHASSYTMLASLWSSDFCKETSSYNEQSYRNALFNYGGHFGQENHLINIFKNGGKFDNKVNSLYRNGEKFEHAQNAFDKTGNHFGYVDNAFVKNSGHFGQPSNAIPKNGDLFRQTENTIFKDGWHFKETNDALYKDMGNMRSPDNAFVNNEGHFGHLGSVIFQNGGPKRQTVCGWNGHGGDKRDTQKALDE